MDLPRYLTECFNRKIQPFYFSSDVFCHSFRRFIYCLFIVTFKDRQIFLNFRICLKTRKHHEGEVGYRHGPSLDPTCPLCTRFVASQGHTIPQEPGRTIRGYKPITAHHTVDFEPI
ncbi:MAG: hypothetical protein CL877_08005 [Dehalococcoidales bacterium]|nr:hypothetical protein [Dehalococcoidales bacterium]